MTNSLYLPDDVTDLVKRTFEVFGEILGAAKLPTGTYRGRDITALKKEASDNIWQLRKLIQQTLGMSPRELPGSLDSSNVQVDPLQPRQAEGAE